jgi:hypothetical protein
VSDSGTVCYSGKPSVHCYSMGSSMVRDYSPVGVPDEQAIGSLLPDGHIDVESHGLVIASLLSE